MDNFTLQVLSTILLPLATLALYFLRRQPPLPAAAPPLSPPWLPIIGHLHLLTVKPHHSLAQLAHKLGPIIHLQLGRVNTVVISSAQLAQLVLKTHDHVFASRPPLLASQYLSFGFSDVTFSPYGAYWWRQARKIYVTELLSSKRVSSFELVRDMEVNRLISSVSTRTGVATNMSELFFNLAKDILCRVAFGKRFMGESGGEERKKPDLATILTETQSLFAGFCIGNFFPGWERVNSVSGMKRRLKNLEELREVCDEIISEHVKKRERKGDIQDFVEVLLRAQERDDLEVPITHDNLKALVLDMFVAGTDATSSTLEWTMTELARHPTVMAKAQEAQKIASTNGKVEQTDLHHLHYLKAVIKEAMRLNPPVPLLVPRESMEDCILNGYNILAKTRVLINTYDVGRDPVSWENPLEFNSDRFEDADADFKGKDFKFLPFGGGRRGCPGFSFVLATIEIALAWLLYHFDWGLPAGVGAEDLDLEEIFGLAMRKKSALVLVPSTLSQILLTRTLV